MNSPLTPSWCAIVATMHSTLPPWSEWLRAANRSEGTIRLRVYHVTRYLNSLPPGTDPLALDSLAQHLANTAWSATYRRSIRTSLRLWTTWLHRTGKISSDPFINLPTSISPHALPRPCPDAAVRSALTRSTTRVQAMIQLAAGAGLRRAEIARIHRDDITPDLLGHSLLVHGKGRRERCVPLSEPVYDALARQLHDLPPGTLWLFPSIGRHADTHLQPIRIGELVNDALPGTWTTHSLRHRFATAAYRDSRDLLLVQNLLGHSKPETTAMYIGLDTSSSHGLVRNIQIAA
ncbi:tyrosine-type recombinase/integrase [Brachybacterium halotolerans]|uniref:tyrosine-type recombinase/integrase n=1 Tax=Brachybacterium halotolerans TaxID=2795215 RepID=UPI002B1D32D1|nr:tyrosine-type recombinase/integrase [Brachybacterium halotolerans]